MSAEVNKERRSTFMSEPKSAAQMVAQAKGQIENLTPQQVVTEIQGGEAILIDIREDD
jgi:hypothetical protein